MIVETSAAVADLVEFHADAIDVLNHLRASVAGVLASVGGMRKPADLQRSFNIDSTLSWQLFHVGSPIRDDATTLAAGAKIPGRASLKRFLKAAESRGVGLEKIERVWSNFERFERLVETHANDRVSFVSMVSAAAGMDADWLAADLQHRRNIFRGLSHIVGMQELCKHACSIEYSEPDGRRLTSALVVGHVGLRLLRPQQKVLVLRLRWINPTARTQLSLHGLGEESGGGGGFLLPEFSTDPLPALTTHNADAGWVVTEMENPVVGNRGACTLRFGSVWRGRSSQDIGIDGKVTDMVVDHPTEVLIMDSLIEADMIRDAKPSVQVSLGVNHSDAPSLPGSVVPVLGDHRITYLGEGPDALGTPDVPNYPELLHAAAAKLGRDVRRFKAWRLRLEYPVYQSTIHTQWTHST